MVFKGPFHPKLVYDSTSIYFKFFFCTAAWRWAVCMRCHQLQFLCRWHHIPGEELIPGQRHVPSLPADGELRPSQGQAQPGRQLHQHGGCRGRGEGRGAGQYHGCAHSFLHLTELHAAAVAFPSTQLGAREERHQRSRNKSEEVSKELLWFTLYPLLHTYLSFELAMINRKLRMSPLIVSFSLKGVKTVSWHMFAWVL